MKIVSYTEARNGLKTVLDGVIDDAEELVGLLARPRLANRHWPKACGRHWLPTARWRL